MLLFHLIVKQLEPSDKANFGHGFCQRRGKKRGGEWKHADCTSERERDRDGGEGGIRKEDRDEKERKTLTEANVFRCNWRINICHRTSRCDLFIFIHTSSSGRKEIPQDPFPPFFLWGEDLACLYSSHRRYSCSLSKLCLQKDGGVGWGGSEWFHLLWLCCVSSLKFKEQGPRPTH